MTYDAVRSLKTYVSTHLQTEIATQAAEHGVTVEKMRDVTVGWADPFALPRYPAALIVPDAAERKIEDQILEMPVWMFLAYKDEDTERLTAIELVVIDACMKLFGSAKIENSLLVFVNQVTPYTPVGGIGVVEVVVTIHIDILGGFE